jgi:hypothetical protein
MECSTDLSVDKLVLHILHTFPILTRTMHLQQLEGLADSDSSGPLPNKSLCASQHLTTSLQ